MIITPSVKKNETNSLFFTDKSRTKRNYEDDLRPKFLSGRCNTLPPLKRLTVYRILKLFFKQIILFFKFRFIIHQKNL